MRVNMWFIPVDSVLRGPTIAKVGTENMALNRLICYLWFLTEVHFGAFETVSSLLYFRAESTRSSHIFDMRRMYGVNV